VNGTRPVLAGVGLARLILFIAKQRFRHLTQPHLLHFGAIGALNARKIIDYHNPLWNFEAR